MPQILWSPLKFQNGFLWWGTLIVVGLAVRLAIFLGMPLWPQTNLFPGYNDEPHHLNYVREVAKGTVWPRFQPELGGITENFTAEFLQPPLYYHLVSPLWSLAESIQEGYGFWGARLGSLMLAALGILFLIRASRMGGLSPPGPIYLLTLTLTFPPFVLFTTLVTNDALLFTVSAILWWRLVRSVDQETNFGSLLTTTFWVGAATWTKLSGALWALMLPIYLFYKTHPVHKPPLSKGLLHLLFAVLALIIICAPLSLWYYTQYGTLLPIEPYPHFSPSAVADVERGGLFYPMRIVKYCLRSMVVPLPDVWGRVGEKLVSLAYASLTTIFIFLGLIACYRHSQPNLLYGGGLILAVILGFLVFNIPQYQAEFRLLMPASPALLTFIAMGAEKVSIPFTVWIWWWVPIYLVMINW